MKRVLFDVAMTVCVLGALGCSSGQSGPEPIQKGDYTDEPGGKAKGK